MNANTIIMKSILASGGNLIDSSKVSFSFRDRHYYAIRNKGMFQLGRITLKNNDSIWDVLSNKGFERLVNNAKVYVTDSMIPKYASSVNSVHYFSVLPYGLNAKAVKKTLLGRTVIKNQDYFKIEVTFEEEGGGEDFDDIFIYWVNAKTFLVEYLAYSYNEEDGLGLRFREAYNERYVSGIRFVDYRNYKPETGTIKLQQLDSLFLHDKLKLLSIIALEHIKVDFNF